MPGPGWFLTHSVPLDPPPDKSQKNPHFTDEDTEAERGDLTCPRSPGQHTGELRLDPKSVQFQSPLCGTEHRWPWRTPSLPTFTPALGLCGTATVPGFWNFLPGLCLQPTSSAGFVLRLALGCGTDVLLPAFVLRDNAIVSPLPTSIPQTPPRQAISKLVQGWL